MWVLWNPLVSGVTGLESAELKRYVVDNNTSCEAGLAMRQSVAIDPRLRAIEWRDLILLSPAEKAWELLLPLPWLIGSLILYQLGWLLPGALCSFYFFLTGLRLSHGAQHYTLGLPRVSQDIVLYCLSVLMLASMHAMQLSHLHHHRHCLGDEDTEGSTARLRWWQAILIGPLFPIRLHFKAWQLASQSKRLWIVAELLAIGLLLATITLPVYAAIRWHISAMIVGESLTGFFAVWTVHHDCHSEETFARTQRGRWITRLSYSMFFHAEHHLFPAVPTCHLARLAERLDAAAADIRQKCVVVAAR